MVLGITLSFTKLIAVSTIVLAVLFFLILILGNRRRWFVGKVPDQENYSQRMRNLLNFSSLTGTLFLLGVSFFPRDPNWFIARLIVLTLILLYAYITPQSKATILYLVINVVAASVAPMISIGFTAGEADQGGHITAANLILTTGHVSLAQLGPLEDPYYRLYPVMDFLVSCLSLTTGVNPFLSIGILQVTIPAVGSLAVVYVSRLLTNDYLGSAVAIIIMLSTDRLALWYLIPENLSLFFAIITFVPMIAFFLSPSKLSLFLTTLFAGFTNFVHASFGGIFILSLPLIALIFWWKKIGLRSLVAYCAASIVVTIGSYWTIWNITSSVGSRLEFVLQVFLSSFSGSFTSAGSSRQSLLALYSSYAYLSWALPAAIAASYLTYKLLSSRLRFEERRDVLLLPITIVGFFILITAFLSTYGQGSLALERYSDIPAYAVFMIVAVFPATIMLRSSKKAISLLIMGLLIISLAVGGTQLNWAPDQFHSSYGYATQEDFNVSVTVLNLLPQNILVYYPGGIFQYFFYWNATKASTFLTSATFANSINGNRSVSTSYLISYAQQEHVATYLIVGSDQLVDFNSAMSSPHLDMVYADSQYYALVAYR